MNDAVPHTIAQLKERRPEIADFLMRCENDHLAPEDFRAMRNCIRHLLTITTGQSAFPLHKLAMTMSAALREDKPAARIDLISLSRALLSACHEALLTTGSPLQSFSPSTALGRKPVLLSVDDDRVIRSMIEAMFGGHATVLTAQNGREGLEMIRLHRPDLVLLDDAMPELTGLRLIELLRKEPDVAFPTVIMLTSSDRPQDLERASAAGAADYVIKPFDPKVLAGKVYGLLQNICARSG